MRIAISGATGLVGSSFAAALKAEGAQVARLVRKNPLEDDVLWDPRANSFDAESLAGCDAVVHLAGENIATGRWNAEKKKRIRSSRVQGTQILAEGLAAAERKPPVLISASAIGFYGDAGNTMLTEQSPAGTDFLAEVCQAWETATQPARDAGIRVVNLRIGVVLSKEGGALAKMLTPFRLGFGGRIGNGKQYWSWITLADLIGVIRHAIRCESLAGPLNAVAPGSVTNAEFTKILGKVLKRPTLFPLPAFAARLMLGEMADPLLLASARISSERLEQSGYTFQFSELEAAFRGVIG